MEDQYGMADLRQYMNITSRPLFPSIPQPPDLLSSHRGLGAAHPYDMLIFRSDSAANNTNGGGTSSSAAPVHCFGGFESGLNGGGGGDGGAGRWPRQETLTLLEIRSRLDPKFKEANQKGPLWDEVSRIMSEEHGYQRSGKKCREKFENLYKYYKKTKEGKAGRQDGKHYRFFRQLEALYGDSNVSASMSESHHSKRALPAASLSLSNHSDTSSTDGSEKMKRSGWKVKIKDYIDGQMRKLMDKQEACMERMMGMIEERERERMMREEEWRSEEAVRVERERKFWASEREWIEARDVALMEALNKLSGERAAEVAACKEKWENVGNYAIKGCKKRKEDLNNQGGEVNYSCDLNHHNAGLNHDHGSSLANPNGISESCFRYFMGDGYGRMVD